MKIQINDTNYHYFKKIYLVIYSHLLKSYPPEIVQNANPVDAINRLEVEKKTIVRRVLKSGLQDLIVQIRDFSPELKRAIDEDLAADKLPSLNELDSSKIKIIARVLKRKKIKTLEEFYIVKEEVIDLSSNLIETDRDALDKALAEFEMAK